MGLARPFVCLSRTDLKRGRRENPKIDVKGPVPRAEATDVQCTSFQDKISTVRRTAA